MRTAQIIKEYNKWQLLRGKNPRLKKKESWDALDQRGLPGRSNRLRKHGFADRAIHDAVQVISYFNYINRIAHGLGVEPETFIQPWGAAEK